MTEKRFKLHVDVESFSSVDLAETGVYRYTEAPDFDLLLVGYAFGDEDVHVIDLMTDGYPGKTETDKQFWKALTDPTVEKLAYNANFERSTLAKYTGKEMRPEQWTCIMIHALVMGLPAGLGAVGDAMGLPKDEQKDKQGKALIQYFCKPCRPTRTNGERTRNLPEHAPEKWELFKEYNRQDVVAERAIAKKLEQIDRPYEPEHRLWCLDQNMNDNGIRLDVGMIEKIVEYDERRGAELLQEAKDITGLDNPNSVTQLKDWLNDQGVPFTSVTKETVAAALTLQYIPENVRRALEIRQALGKASVKKYAAMLNAVCEDGRLRGILQFYGANRSGRWAGRLVQVHNLARNSLPDLDLARELAERGDFDTMQTLFGETSFVFSELVRTAFIPSEGCRFVVSDFSAIEARVLAWMAGEQWVLDAFREGKDIYCETASMMYKVPVVKHGENGHLRAKGKVAVLACIAEGQQVLTDQGLVNIENVTKDMKVWDGVEWVSHDGVVCRGEKEVISYGGLEATADHIVWAEMHGERRQVQFGDAARSGAHLTKSGTGRQAIRLGEDNQPGKALHEGMGAVHGSDGVHGMRPEVVDVSFQPDERKDKGMPEMQHAASRSALDRQTDDSSETAMRESEGQELQELRSEGHPVRVPERDGRVSVHGRELRHPGQVDGNRQDQRQRKLCSGEPEMDRPEDERRKQTHHGAERVRSEVLAVCRNNDEADAVCRYEPPGDNQHGGAGSHGETQRLETHPRKVRVYDIRSAGPRNRFTVSNVLVHNCGYGGGVGALKAMDSSGAIPEEEMQDIVDAWRNANPRIVKLWKSYEMAAKNAITERRTVKQPRGIEFSFHDGCLFVKLPGGRKLCYWGARIKEDPMTGRESICYMGVNQETKKWGETETWGGKLVENCIAEDTQVLTDSGWKPIQEVTTDDMLWDGNAWVKHDGLINKGLQEVISVDGVLLTPDHMILTEEGWKHAKATNGTGRPAVRLPDGYQLRRIRRTSESVEDPVRLREGVHDARLGVEEAKTEVMRVHDEEAHRREEQKARDVEDSALGCLAFHEGEMRVPDGASVEELRGTRDSSLREVVEELRSVPGRHGSDISEGADVGQDRRQRRLHTGELQVDHDERAVEEQTNEPLHQYTVGADDSLGSVGEVWNRNIDTVLPIRPWRAGVFTVHEAGLQKQVYDLKNAGAEHRFTVAGINGPVIVHNCTQSVARDCLAEAMQRVTAAGYNIVMHVHDEMIVDAPNERTDAAEEITELMSRTPDWAEGLPLKGETYETAFYKKD